MDFVQDVQPQVLPRNMVQNGEGEHQIKVPGWIADPALPISSQISFDKLEIGGQSFNLPQQDRAEVQPRIPAALSAASEFTSQFTIAAAQVEHVFVAAQTL